MSEGSGETDGMNALGGVRPLADSMVADAGRRRPHVEGGRWPAAGTVLRVVALLLLALVLLGWALTALNS